MNCTACFLVYKVAKAHVQVAMRERMIPLRKSGFKKSFKMSIKNNTYTAETQQQTDNGFLRNFSFEINNPITTSQSGKMAPMMEPSPADDIFHSPGTEAIAHNEIQKTQYEDRYPFFSFWKRYPPV